MQSSTQILGRGLFVLFFFLTFLTPNIYPANAASLVPCGLSSGTAAEMAPCTLCHLLFGIQTVLTWMRNVMTAIAIAVIVGMGILYIVSAGNDSLMSYAKGGIKASLIGFALILGAWLIVNVIFNLPVFNNASGLVRENWFTFSCNLASNANTGTLSYNPGVTPTTPASQVPPNPIVNPIDLTGSTGVTFSLPTSQVYPGNLVTLTLGGNLNFNLGPVTFSFDTATFSIPDARTLSVPITVLSSARPGDYTIKAYQNGVFLGEFTLTVKAIPFNPGTDPGGSGGGSGGGGGGGGGGSCSGNSPSGLPYNPNLPHAPLKDWSAQDLYSYWQTLPSDPYVTPLVNALKPPQPSWDQCGKFHMDYIGYNTLTNGHAFEGLIYTSFGCSSSACPAFHNWVNGNELWCHGASFDLQTGIAWYSDSSGTAQAFGPSSGIPCP